MKRTPIALATSWITFWATLAVIAVFTGTPEFNLSRTLGGPEWTHPLGFDAFGRDLFRGILRATASSAFFAGCATAFACVFGAILGTSIALAGRRTRYLALRSLDTLLAFPSLLLALGWAAARGPGWDTLLISLALGTLPGFTRLLYSRALELKAEEYVLAAEAIGASSWRILRVHLSPPLFSLCAIKAPGIFANALLAEATLSFLGVGAPIGSESWGGLLAQGADYLLEAPHLAVATGIPLIFTILSLQLLSEKRTTRHLRNP